MPEAWTECTDSFSEYMYHDVSHHDSLCVLTHLRRVFLSKTYLRIKPWEKHNLMLLDKFFRK